MAYTSSNGTDVSYDKFGRTFYTHPTGLATNGSISLNVVNLQFVLSIGTLAVNHTLDIDLGGLHNVDPRGGAGAATSRDHHAIKNLHYTTPSLMQTYL